MSAGLPDAASPLLAYERIREHAELELELAGRGELAALAALAPRWRELAAGLPARPPRGAAGVLERARLMQQRTRVELERLRGSLMSDLATAARARRTADGYAGSLPRRPRVERSA